VNRIPDDGQTGEVTLTYAALADRQAQPVRVTIDATPVKPSAVPARFALHSATPNPFNPNTTITFDVPEQTHILLVVYNLIGQEVARLVDAVKPPGRYTVIWDGRDARRHAVSSGVYLYRLTTDAGFCATKRVTLLK
jgi:hypothetical protein